MKKKNTTLLLLVALIVIAGGYFAFFHKWHGPDNEFHILDPKAVGKIDIAQVTENETTASLSLLRNGGDEWTVNGKFPASLVQVNNFLKTLTDIRVKEPIGDKAQATSLSLLKRNHLHVQIWDLDGGVLKEYLIGPTNSQQTANIFKMAHSDQCYMVSKPAMDGYVSIAYSTVQEDWRDKALWSLSGDEIEFVAARYKSDTAANSFRLQSLGESWMVNDVDTADAARVSGYLALFQGKANAESFADQQYPDMRDSLAKREADAVFEIKTKQNLTISLSLFARPEASANFFAIVEGKNELLTVQHFVIDPFLKARGYFVAARPTP